MTSRGRALTCLGIAAAWRGALGSCAFRFGGYLNISESPTWTVPATASSESGYRVLNEYSPILYAPTIDTSSSGSQATQYVNCTGTSWRYVLAGGAYETNVAFPASDSNTTTADVSVDGLFNATGGYVLVDSIPAEIAVAVSDSLYGRTIEVGLSCSQEETVAEEDSCIVFEVNFTNASPLPDVDTALYRFTDPVVPGVVMPPSGNFSPGDIQLNEGNPIVQLDGSDVEIGCNGDKAEYLGEDGEWYFWFTGSNGYVYNLTHVFYATEQDHLNIATIQTNWSPNLEAALYNRTVRLLIYCNNIDVREEGYIFFRVGDGSSAFDSGCEDIPCLCDGAEDGCTSAAPARFGGGGSAAGRGWAAAMYSLVTAGAVSAYVGDWSSPKPWFAGASEL